MSQVVNRVLAAGLALSVSSAVVAGCVSQTSEALADPVDKVELSAQQLPSLEFGTHHHTEHRYFASGDGNYSGHSCSFYSPKGIYTLGDQHQFARGVATAPYRRTESLHNPGGQPVDIQELSPADKKTYQQMKELCRRSDPQSGYDRINN